MLLLIGAVIGILAGWLRGGRVTALGSVHIRWWIALFVALGVQVLIFSTPLAHSKAIFDHGGLIYSGSLLLVLVVVSRNLLLPGIQPIFLGLVLNAVVVILNGGQMPVDLTMLEQAGIHWPTGTYAFSNVTPATATTLLPFLGDTIVTPAFLPVHDAYSIGDLLISLGGALFVALAMLGRSQFRQVPTVSLSAP